MQREQLSVTTWPGQPVPVPQLRRFPLARLDGETIWLGNSGYMGDSPLDGELIDVPDQMYLRQVRDTDQSWNVATPNAHAKIAARTRRSVT